MTDTHDWETLRQRILWRDGSKCYICGSRRELSPHHIKPRDMGGLDEERNLITLCNKCHDYVEGEDWVFINKMKEDKEEEKELRYNKSYRMKYGEVIDMYMMINDELVKIGERYV